MRSQHLSALTILWAFGTLGTAQAAPYIMTDIGTLGGNNTNGTSINASGQITGWSQDSSGNQYIFTYSNGLMTSLGMVGIGRNINSFGQVEGNLSNGHIFVYSNGSYTDLGIPLNGTSCKAYGFNDNGQITGQVTLPSGQIHGFVYTPGNGGSTVDIGTIGSQSNAYSYGSSINALAQVEGDSTTASGNTHAFIWSNGQFTDLGTFGGPASSGVAINAKGHATGTSQTAASGTTPSTWISHVFLWNGVAMVDCGTLGGNYANAGAMNNLDQIVGYSYLADNVTQHAFYYANGVMTDLNALVPANTGWTLTTANGITDSGLILAEGVNAQGVDNAFLLTPNVPEPGAIGLVLLAGAAFLLRRVRPA